MNSFYNATGFDGQVAIVTGAAGGIGAEITRKLAQSGSIVAAADCNAEALHAFANELRSEGLNVNAYIIDVGSSRSVESFVDKVEKQLGPIHYLINAAGVLRVGQTTQISDEDWDITMRVNASGAFYMSRTVARKMIACGDNGAIVSLASNAALIARMDMAAYAASKAAVIAMTKCLGLELAKYGIRCNIVAPGSTDTEMLRSLWMGNDSTKISIEGSLEDFRVGVPLKRIAQPSHVADTVLFLLSEQAAHITMETLTVDGGATLGA